MSLCKTGWRMWALAWLLLPGKGRRSEDKHACTHPCRCSWKNEVRFRRSDSKENRSLKLLWGISHLHSVLSYVSHTSAPLSMNKCWAKGNWEEYLFCSWEPKKVWASDPDCPRPPTPVALLVKCKFIQRHRALSLSRNAVSTGQCSPEDDRFRGKFNGQW